jgi:putative transposase
MKGQKIRIPNLGWVKLAEPLRFQGKILGATVSRKADEWFVSVQVEMPDPAAVHEPLHEGDGESRVGVELDKKCFATLTKDDQQEIVEGPKEHRALLGRLRRLSRSLDRKVGARRKERKSRNYLKTRKKLARLHVRVENIRTDALHKLTTNLAKHYGAIDVESDKAPELKRREPPSSMKEASAFEFRRQLEYKAKITGSNVRFK